MSENTRRSYESSWFEGCVEWVWLLFFGPRNWEMRIPSGFEAIPRYGLEKLYFLRVRTKEKSDYQNNHDKVLACFTGLEMMVIMSQR